MDANRFDSLSRTLFASPSRRSILGLATGTGLGALLPLADVAARKKKKKRKKGKCGTVNCPAGSKNCSGACVPNDACCPSCTAGFTCLSNGSCGRACIEDASCPSSCGKCNGNVEGQRICITQGSCEIIGEDCTTMADCPQGYQCQLNSCPPGVATRCLPLCTS